MIKLIKIPLIKLFLDVAKKMRINIEKDKVFSVKQYLKILRAITLLRCEILLSPVIYY